ncbi:MAG: hypothetical protein AMJ84_04845 [Acidithiobacillales bacterium SM23_46]|nr:MAG: hypothetical protein AMJ84_04845 [Acidithiobacillales bacterium SM23_46]
MDDVRGLYYFLPNVQSVAHDIKALGQHGISHLFLPGDGITHIGQSNGPGGHNGIIITRSIGGQPVFPRYEPEKQRWLECDEGKWWVGVYKEHSPEPGDLQRFDAVRGIRLELGDGHFWIIPQARIDAHSLEGSLPQSVSVDRSGNRILCAMSAHENFNALASRLAPYYVAQMAGLAYDGPQPGRDDHFELAVRALESHYLVDRYVIAVLGLLTTEREMRIGQAACDLAKLLELAEAVTAAAKKNEPVDISEYSCSESGNADDGPSTDLPLES